VPPFESNVGFTLTACGCELAALKFYLVSAKPGSASQIPLDRGPLDPLRGGLQSRLISQSDGFCKKFFKGLVICFATLHCDEAGLHCDEAGLHCDFVGLRGGPAALHRSFVSLHGHKAGLLSAFVSVPWPQSRST
jgi:hypothetical protein